LVGIVDVAKAAGVSPSTVSNVLNGRDARMRSETKERVLKAIRDLKYTPNAFAQQLKSGQNQTIGLIVPSVVNPFWGSVAHHVERAALRRNYKVLIGNAERDVHAEVRYAETLLGSNVRGVILGSAPLSFEHLRDLVNKGLIVGSFDRRSEGANELVSTSVSVDQFLGGQLAAQHLIGLGHRRIAFISGPIRTTSRLGRLAGVKAAHERAGIAFDPDLVWEGGSGVIGFGDTEGLELGRGGIRELLSRDNPPTAVIAVNDMYALGVYAGARDLGYTTPSDLSVVGFDDIVISEVVQPPLTTIRQPIPAMADSIVESLIAQVEDSASKTDGPHLEVTPQLMVRASTSAPRPSALASGPSKGLQGET
jgi:DNA-binding LacI/PurR family transcriptional regulator